MAQENEDLSQPYEIGTFAEEHLPFLTDSGLDLEDPEACECAAEMVQLQEEAYYAGKQATTGQPGRDPMGSHEDSDMPNRGSWTLQAFQLQRGLPRRPLPQLGDRGA